MSVTVSSPARRDADPGTPKPDAIRVHAALVDLLVRTLEARDPLTSGHSQRVAQLARSIGRKLDLSDAELRNLEWAGLLHDVGKLGIPERILQKTGALTEDEFVIIRRHPRIGHDLLEPVEGLEAILPAVLHHHENIDGSGYPDGLAGEAIPLAARILRVADTYDAIISERSYRAPRTHGEAVAELRRGAGVEYDARVVEAFVSTIPLLPTRPRNNDPAAPDANHRYGVSLPRPSVQVISTRSRLKLGSGLIEM